MKIVVKGENMIASIQQEFHENFPFLRVEFYQSNSGNHKASEKKRVTAHKPFSSFGNHSNREHITITPSMTVSELERKIRDSYGLETQVFRKSGKVWLETTLTDHWSLHEQNEQGKALSS